MFLIDEVSIGGRRLDSRWWILLLEGLADICIGIMAVVWPALTILVLVMIIGFWALLTGVLEIFTAIKLRHQIRIEWLLGLSGAISIIFSLILFINPGAGAVVLVWLLGAYDLIFGLSMIFLGLKLRKHRIIVL